MRVGSCLYLLLVHRRVIARSGDRCCDGLLTCPSAVGVSGPSWLSSRGSSYGKGWGEGKGRGPGWDQKESDLGSNQITAERSVDTLGR